MPLDERTRKWKSDTVEAITKIDSYDKEPKPIIIDQKDIIIISAKVLLSASTLLTGFWSKAFLLIGNIIIKSFPKKGDSNG